MTPAGWYPDPSDPAFLRWWDGSMWTNHQMPRPTDVPPANAAADEAATPEAVAPEESPALPTSDSANVTVAAELPEAVEAEAAPAQDVEVVAEDAPASETPASEDLGDEAPAAEDAPADTPNAVDQADSPVIEYAAEAEESAPGGFIAPAEPGATAPLAHADNTPVDQGDTVFMSPVAAPAGTGAGFAGFPDQGVAPAAQDPALDATVVTPGGYGLHAVDPAAAQPGMAPYPGQPAYPAGAYPGQPAAPAAPNAAPPAMPLQPLDAAPSAPRRRKGPIIAAVLVIIMSLAISITMLYMYFSYDGMKKSYDKKIQQLKDTIAEQTEERDAIDTEISDIEKFLGKEAKS